MHGFMVCNLFLGQVMSTKDSSWKFSSCSLLALCQLVLIYFGVCAVVSCVGYATSSLRKLQPAGWFSSCCRLNLLLIGLRRLTEITDISILCSSCWNTNIFRNFSKIWYEHFNSQGNQEKSQRFKQMIGSPIGKTVPYFG
jgi:hypothetical protein